MNGITSMTKSGKKIQVVCDDLRHAKASFRMVCEQTYMGLGVRILDSDLNVDDETLEIFFEDDTDRQIHHTHNISYCTVKDLNSFTIDLSNSLICSE